MCQTEMQITPSANQSVISDHGFIRADCYDCCPVVYPPLPPEENVMESLTRTITYRWHYPHDFSSAWWLVFLYNWCKLSCSHLLHMYYVVSLLTVRTRTTQLSVERQYSGYLPGTGCGC